MAEEFDRLLVGCPNNGGMFLFSHGIMYQLDSLDTTGVTVKGDRLVRALQPDCVAMLGAVQNELDGTVGQFDDLHDVLLEDSCCYVVSTRHNEILKFDVTGAEIRRWTFPGEPDSWHINCLARWNGRVVFSAFCDRTTHRGYKENPLDVGFVQDLHSGERLITGLTQPHSLTTIGDSLVLANSGAFEIHEYDADAVLVRKQSMTGYTRGIVQHASCIYVGVSKTRNVTTVGPKSAELIALDANTWQELDRKTLPVDEIYSVQHLSAERSVDILAQISSHANSRLAAMLRSAKAELGLATDAVEEKESRIQTFVTEIGERQRQVFGLLETIHGKDLHIRSQDALIESKDQYIKNLDSLIESKDQHIKNRDAVIERKDQHIEKRDVLIQEKENQLKQREEVVRNLDILSAEKEARIASLTKALEQREQRIAELELDMRHHADRAEHLQARVDSMEGSRSWKATALLRWLSGQVRPVIRMARAGAFVLCNPLRYMRLARELGFIGTLSTGRSFIVRGGPQTVMPVQAAAPVFDVRTPKGQPVGILTTQHCLFIAELIADALQRLGISSQILCERPAGGFRDVPHFVICPQMFETLPGLYVAFQMEQSVSSRWFTKDYLRSLENAFAIFDYSVLNIKKLTSMGLSPRQFFHVPVGPLASYRKSHDAEDAGYEYDVIFYGDVNNGRRQAFLAALEKVCRIKVVSNLFGEELHQELRKARLVVNIHYYEGALLETTRLWECLSLGKFVISERSSDMKEQEELVDLVDFIDVGDIEGMVQRVRHWLNAPAELERRIQANNQALDGTCSRFTYFFYRFMLYSGNMSFGEFWSLVGEKLPPPAEKLCLNLPEYVDRAEAFDKDNTHGFTRFAGLKHPYGWMGCAMSYKFMAMWARKHRMQQLIVCEDDVEFPSGFDSKWALVSQHLNKTSGEWDLFSGILADLHEDATIIDSHTADGSTYVVLDRMISTVYNVYGEKALELLSKWDDQNYHVESNTIDRYMERCTHLRVMTTLPFLVGHKEELYSTLWGMQNTQYTKLIEASQALLQRKVKDWHVRIVKNV